MFCHKCGIRAEASAMFCTKCGAALRNEATIQPTMAPSFAPANESADSAARSQLAERSTRLGAVILDFLIFMACLIPGIIVVSVSDADGGKGFGWALIAVAWLGLAVVQIVLLVKHGQSLGKRVLGIRIVRVSDESIPGFVKVVLLRLFVPSLIAGIPYAGAIIWLVDALFIFREDRRCLHDLIAETKIIKV